ncbi:flagellar filament capping protein FliD [Aneurinibacillus sp. Ricciae_BoGa-3]|uniref:flagellar filament capping protein FliD n=1 Tax=Aneurinibacillus sp. Ricciae_BoGa-3 TaxID=3022697 RepID=UPI0023412C67|nr:flagellar filament capping protein FliD [Aneurinibacillus sp. Ricciae_BoGa-3]WCK54185.1 flagellar filament capping protein FliD [Aneurinibacillus sp. Ricciae_BoGa-3]
MDFSSGITRVSGLVSGINTDSIVQKLMTAESANYNKMIQQQQKLNWQSDAYRQWNTDLLSFVSNLSNMKYSKNYSNFNMTSSDSNTVSAVGTPNAVEGTQTIRVAQIAQSAAFKATNVNIDNTKSLSDASQKNPLTIANGQTFEQLNLTVTDSNGTRTGSIKVNLSDTIGNVISNLNTATDGSGNSLGIQAMYDSNLQQVIIKTQQTGANTKIDLSANDSNSNVFNVLGFTNNGNNPNGVTGNALDPNTKQPTGAAISVDTSQPNRYIITGADASITFNGTQVSQSTNNVTLLGVNYTFKRPMQASEPDITVNASRDIDTEVKNIEDFITQYNTMNDKIYNALNEPVYSDYQPLTDDQRSAMSDTQIQQWETKAKSGLLHGDSILNDLYNGIRNATSSTVNNGSKYSTLASIGITSSSYQDHGKLTVDETKLRAAIQADPTGVQALFSQLNPTDPDKTKSGIINRLYDTFNAALQQTITKAGAVGNAVNDQSTIGQMITDIGTRINNEKSRLTNVENSYYQQFTAMETAMSQYQSQSSWLTQQLGGGK